ncbi:hypothetical protein B0H14DRAFT_3445128 [Mycena olivaceomarginata]|nr:hypothetical protein B0H14DRAFT_3445128 [Mycena olivaceomarginata]
MPSISTSLLAISLFLGKPSLPRSQRCLVTHVVWSDDFNGAQGLGIDHSKWAQAGSDWQATTASSRFIPPVAGQRPPVPGDGQLYIIPTKSRNTWYSGRIESMASQSCAAGLGGGWVFPAELWVPRLTGVSAKSAGLWPAFWTLGQSFRSGAGWPKCGEWDIFERRLRGLVNYAGGQYHTWAFKIDRHNPDGKQQKLTWYLDETEYYSVTGAQIGGFTQWTELAYNRVRVIFVTSLLRLGLRNFVTLMGTPVSRDYPAELTVAVDCRVLRTNSPR